MSVLMNFYAGDAQRIAGALEDEPGTDLVGEGIALAQADFSLHIGEDTLDEMLAAACEHQKIKRLTWESVTQDSLTESVLRMPPEFVRVFAAIGGDDLVKAAGPWMGETLTPDLAGALREIVALCKVAESKKADVVYACFA